jgi:dynein heavy chain
MGHMVGIHLGDLFSHSPPSEMAAVFDDMDNKTPCIFVLSAGADPSSMLLRFAKQLNMNERLGIVSLGQGQGVVSESLINAGCKSGDWVLLQNCMLAKSWMPRLEQLCFDLRTNAETSHDGFRLFLTSLPVDYFPVSVLQNGVKMTTEPPKGLRAGVMKDFATFAKEDTWNAGRRPRAWQKVMLGMTFLCSLLADRRKFGPLGWNILYEFTETDLETSLQCLQRFIEMDDIPWEALAYVTGEINFGGRVTDDWDRRCLMSILRSVINPKILDDEFKFSASGVYFAPPMGTIASYKDYIEKLPMTEDPEIFGMHQNANTIYNRDQSRNLFHSLLSLMPRDSGGGGGLSSDEIVNNLAIQIADGLPDNLDHDAAGEGTFVIQANGLLTSLMIVLEQEMVKFNRLLTLMRGTLVDVRRAIQGMIIMTNDLDNMYNGFIKNALPGNWRAVSFATMKTLGSWTKDCFGRVQFMRAWLLNGQPPTFPLQTFFFPQGFMTGTLQTFARKHHVAVNTLAFQFHVEERDIKEITESPEDGVICDGMWCEGGRYCPEKKLVQQSKLGEIYTRVICAGRESGGGVCVSACLRVCVSASACLRVQCGMRGGLCAERTGAVHCSQCSEC